MDNLEIPNPNHFGEVGTGGGGVNILNTEFVERIDFFAGGFLPAMETSSHPLWISVLERGITIILKRN